MGAGGAITGGGGGAGGGGGCCEPPQPSTAKAAMHRYRTEDRGPMVRITLMMSGLYAQSMLVSNTSVHTLLHVHPNRVEHVTRGTRSSQRAHTVGVARWQSCHTLKVGLLTIATKLRVTPAAD